MTLFDLKRAIAEEKQVEVHAKRTPTQTGKPAPMTHDHYPVRPRSCKCDEVLFDSETEACLKCGKPVDTDPDSTTGGW
ncbi:MAG: hypothetical protein M3355_12005 [Actinomycetota bacterium]|nr:hypothetical protein [Actinomycetota bacterium]